MRKLAGRVGATGSATRPDLWLWPSPSATRDTLDLKEFLKLSVTRIDNRVVRQRPASNHCSDLAIRCCDWVLLFVDWWPVTPFGLARFLIDLSELKAAFMIESIMYFVIGFLVAALFGLAVTPLVHNRAARLTVRRLEAAIPLSMAEIQADKDLLRAEFAMSTRRLEMNVEQLKAKNARQLAELGKKGDAINRLKIELGALRDQLSASEESAANATAVSAAERTLADRELELAKLKSALDERSVLADLQKVEILGLRMKVQTLNDRLTQTGDEVRAVKDCHYAERIDLNAVTQKLMEERGKFENFHRRVAELVQQLVAQRATSQLLTGEKYTPLPH